MGNLVRRYLGYGYGRVHGHVPSGPPVLSCDSVRVWNQANLAVHSKPLLVLAFLRSSHSVTLDLEQENNQKILHKSQVPQADPHATGLHNSN
jgi:hypothetical protein